MVGGGGGVIEDGIMGDDDPDAALDLFRAWVATETASGILC